jgi:cytochrome b6-f complex iron-sulfur subunit
MEVLLIAIPLLVVLGLVALVASARRRDVSGAGTLSRETRARDRARAKGDVTAADEAEAEALTGKQVEKQAVLARTGALEPVEPAPPAPYVPPDEETVGVTRRQFFNRSIVAMFGLGLSGFGAAALAFIWPRLGGGFGGKINVGSVEEVKAQIQDANNFLYVAEGKMWVTEYPAGALDKAQAVYSAPELAGMDAGLVALFQTCPHLGCRVPECATSQWFECPCHGSRYNRVGEKRGGPAPRGMDRFAMSIEGGSFVVDTGLRIQGPPIGTNTTGQEPEGPSCLGGSSH